MGIYYSYFFATDAAAAMTRAERNFLALRGDDFVSLKFVDHHVKLPAAIAALGTAGGLDLTKTTFVWPPEESKPRTREEARNPPPDSPWANFHFSIEMFDPGFRDALAAIDINSVKRLAKQGAFAETWEIDGFDAKAIAASMQDLARLAGRAKAAGALLFVHTSGF